MLSSFNSFVLFRGAWVKLFMDTIMINTKSTKGFLNKSRASYFWGNEMSGYYNSD